MVMFKSPNRAIRMAELCLARGDRRYEQRSISFRSSLVLPDEGRVEREPNLGTKRGELTVSVSVHKGLELAATASGGHSQEEDRLIRKFLEWS
jgi:hypothetical protein